MRPVKIDRSKALILGSAALIVLALVGGAAYLVLSGGEKLKYETQAALRDALPTTAAAELRKHGVSLAAPLKCADLPGRTEERLGVSCRGATSDDKPVEVIGSGDKAAGKSHYTILVDGRPIVQNAPCLGADCDPRKEG